MRIIVGRNSEQANVELPTKNDSPVNLQSFWYTFGFCGVYLTGARCFYTCSTRTQIGFNLDAAPTNSTRKFAVGALRACVRSTANSSSLLSSQRACTEYTPEQYRNIKQRKAKSEAKRAQYAPLNCCGGSEWREQLAQRRARAPVHSGCGVVRKFCVSAGTARVCIPCQALTALLVAFVRCTVHSRELHKSRLLYEGAAGALHNRPPVWSGCARARR